MDTSSKMELRNLPFAPRLVLSVFLVSIGVGYLSALVQLHFQHAKAGQLLPGKDDAQRVYHGTTLKPQSHIQRLLESPEDRPFNGTGQMRHAFTIKSDGWNSLIRKMKDPEKEMLGRHREGERLAFLDWIRFGASEEEYDKNSHLLSAYLAAEQPISVEFLVKDANDKPVEPRQVAIKTLIEKRCVDCHMGNGRFSETAQFKLDSYDRLRPYLESEPTVAGMSLSNCSNHHIHLLSFSILYGLTGLIFAFTSYPSWCRVLLAPLPLAAQLVDVACWWLRVMTPCEHHHGDRGLVAASLLLQIVLSLFNMYGRHGKKVGRAAALGAAAGFVAKTIVIDPYLEQNAPRPLPRNSMRDKRRLSPAPRRNSSARRAVFTASWLCRLNSTWTPPAYPISTKLCNTAAKLISPSPNIK